jgi:5-methylcytosine-specific restriction endonuclease McrA
MKSEADVQALVKHWVKYCIEYVESGRIEKKKQIKGLDRTALELEIGKPCITCKEKMVRNIHKKGVTHLPNSFTAEHIVPRTLGGNNVRNNLVAMCHDCNRARGVMVARLLPYLNGGGSRNIRGKPLSALNRSKISRFVEWAIRTTFRPVELDSELCQLFNEIRSKELYPLGITTITEFTPGTIDSPELLDILNQILETQKAILEQLQKSPLRRLRDWIVGFLPKRKPRKSIEKKSGRKRTRSRKNPKKKEAKMSPDKKKSGPNNKYFCPTCNTLFTKWGKAKLHKKETGHGCRVCDDCGDFFTQDKLRQAHEDETGHTKYSGQFFGQKRMAIKHYLPEERLEVVDSLKKNQIDTQGFTKVIEELLGEDEVRATAFGNRVRSYQKANDWPRLGSTAFLDAFGIPAKTGLVNAIISILGDRVTVIGDDPVTRKIRLNSKRTTPETEPEPESPQTHPKQAEIKQDGDVFPIVDGLNSSTKGFRFPRYPRQLAEALIWFEHNHQLYPTTVGIKSAMNAETELARTRVNYLITKMGNIVKPKTQGGISSADWSTASNMPAIDIIDALQTWLYQICMDKQIEVTPLHTEYFSQVRNHISGKTEEE